ncbi:AAA family ATPase [Photobacterium swingsii]|uniref:AAA family ATPase n=1 Tax=Photobacterium swingsii TaxID=680026 RepID=UPI00352F7302
MSTVSFTIQIVSVYPGIVGGAIFSGTKVGGRENIFCRAAQSAMTRIPKQGEFWEVRGIWQKYESKRSGVRDQILVAKAQLVNLPLASYVGSLLAKHPAFRGFYFGQKKIAKLLEVVEPAALVEMLNKGDYTRLCDVLHPDIAKRLMNAWLSLKDEIEIVNFLAEHNFDPALTRKVLGLTKRNTVVRLKANPYALVCFLGISKHIWGTVESCAQKMEIKRTDPRRLQAGVELVLYERLQQGHTAYPIDDVIVAATRRLGTKARAIEGIEYALKSKAICVLDLPNDRGRLLQLVGPALIENMLTARINKLLKNPTSKEKLFDITPSDVMGRLDIFDLQTKNEMDFSLTSEQRNAVVMALTTRCSVITGFGGTGKTTVLKAVSDIAIDFNRTVYGIALSGKAKTRLAEATGLDALTIHGFLLLVKKNKISITCNPVLIVDEASMVDVALFNRLLTVFDNLPFTLITVGDPSQISPVGFGLAWHKMVKSQRVPITHLTKAHRQALESPLHRASMLIRDGIAPPIKDWQGEKEGIYFVECSRDAQSLKESLLDAKLRIPELQTISPHVNERMSDSGTGINTHIQKQLTGRSPDDDSDTIPEFRVGKQWLRVGDPVIVTENNYDLELFNGTTGMLVSAGTYDNGVYYGVFHFEGDSAPRELTIDMMLDVNLKLAYCISIHKSQGSEYPSIAIACISNTELVERSLMYTAVTRSKKLCLIVGCRDVFERVIAKQPRAETLYVGLQI